jgi:hypothetical protein
VTSIFYLTGDPEAGHSGYSLDRLSTIPRANKGGTIPLQNFYAHPSDWPGVFWLDEPEGGALPVAGENMGGTGRWYDSYGGGCSGNTAPFGYW